MITIGATFFGIAAIATAIYRPELAWGILAIPLCWMLFVWLALRSKPTDPPLNLSPAAAQLLRNFGQTYYTRPYAGAAYSSVASSMTFVCIAVGVVGAWRGFWWGVAIGAIAYGFFAFLARQFNPTNFLVDDEERLAHLELAQAILVREHLDGLAAKSGERAAR